MRRKKARRKGVRRGTPLPGAARRPTRSARVVNPDHLMAALAEELERLREERTRLDSRIEVIENCLRALQGVPQPERNLPGVSLSDYILRVMAPGQPMSVKEITTAVLAAGYQSRNKTLSKTVGALLGKMPGVERVGRGIYRRSKS